MTDKTESIESPETVRKELPDLSAQIISSIERQPGDLVRCTWIGGDKYRVNWWSARSVTGYDNPAIFGATYGTHVVRQSQFLKVTLTPQGLKFRDAAAAEMARGRLR
jgi:hypothetical protein